MIIFSQRQRRVLFQTFLWGIILVSASMCWGFINLPKELRKGTMPFIYKALEEYHQDVIKCEDQVEVMRTMINQNAYGKIPYQLRK